MGSNGQDAQETYNKIDFLTPSGKNLGMLKPTKVKIKKKE